MKRIKLSNQLNYILISFTLSVIVLFVSIYYLSTKLYDLAHKIYHHPFIVTNEIRSIDINIKNIENELKELIYNKEKKITIDTYKINLYENQIENSLFVVQERYSGDIGLVLKSINEFNEYKEALNTVITKYDNVFPDSNSLSFESASGKLKNSLSELYQMSLNNAFGFYNKIDKEKNSLLIIFSCYLISIVVFSIIIFIKINFKIKRPIENVIKKIEIILDDDKYIDVKIKKKNDIELLIYTISYLENLKNLLKNEIESKKVAEQRLLKFNEELKGIMGSKEKLFSIIAHDLINPFQAIIGLSDYLIENLNNISKDEINEILNNISKSAISQHSLLRNLLEWSRVQTGEIKLRKEVLKISNLINDIFDQLKLVSESKEIKLVNNVIPNLYIYADKKMLEVILRNLITNAIKYSYSGGNILIYGNEDNDCTKIQVKDFGKGMESDTISEVLNSGFVSSENGTKGERGSGLGLQICKEFVTLQGGKIWVESEINKGSTFCISFPKY